MKLKKLAHILFLVGYGITLHAVANELYWKTQDYTEILSPQGEWIGLALTLIAYIILTHKRDVPFVPKNKTEQGTTTPNHNRKHPHTQL